MTKTHLMNNCLLKMAHSLYILEALATEFYKIENGYWPELFTEIFARETEPHYNIRRCSDFRIPSIRTVCHGSKSISFLGPKIWNILPNEIKQQTSLNNFKKSVNKWKPKHCPIKLCKVYINGVGFLSQLSSMQRDSIVC